MMQLLRHYTLLLSTCPLPIHHLLHSDVPMSLNVQEAWLILVFLHLTESSLHSPRQVSGERAWQLSCDISTLLMQLLEDSTCDRRAL